MNKKVLLDKKCKRKVHLHRLMFVIPFLVISCAKADFILTGNVRPGCGTAGRSSVATTPVLHAPSESAVYLNLAQVITKAASNTSSNTSRSVSVNPVSHSVVVSVPKTQPVVQHATGVVPTKTAVYSTLAQDIARSTNAKSTPNNAPQKTQSTVGRLIR